jgi:isocitrate dehydrogenase
MTQQLVKNPERFNQNILLSTNLFMDIISECASGHVGSIGNVYSGNFGESYAMFEPAHGSAPKYSGMDKVNPVASILSGAWMVKYLGEADIASAIFEATEKIVADGKFVTYDLGGESSLSGMSSEISQKSSNLLRK